MIQAMGGIETVRIIHRIAASILILGSVYHIIALAYKIFVRRVGLPMLPTFQDVIDFLDAVRFNLGLARKRPYYDRFSFEEKIEYWAVIWGTIVMIVTGFMLWNPISTTRLLPGSWIPAAKAAHGGEALLAFLAIIVWHLYNVHIKTFNRSIFTGKLTREQMEHEHPKELDRIEAGLVRPEPPREAIRRRERIFLPIAAVFVVVTLIVFYVFVTFEDTAIATIPPQPESVEIFVPATPTPVPTPSLEQFLDEQRGVAVVIPHDITGRENCLTCHGAGALIPYTPIHAELRLGNDTCLNCHALASTSANLPTVAAADIPSFSTDILPVLQRRCTACHGTGNELSLVSYEALMKGGKNGPVITPGDAEGSRLLLVQSMPLAAHPTRLTPEELQQVRVWVQAGAPNN